MILTVFFVMLVLLFILPFLPGLHELREKTDAAPLFINMDYSKDPCYFAVSFRKILADSLPDQNGAAGLHILRLSKQEVVEVIDNASVADGNVRQNIYYVKNKLESGKNVTFEKEVYVQGTARIGEKNQLRALACDGDVHILSGARFVRWLDAAGSVRAGERCDLGISATSSQELSLAQKCSFKRLYGFPVVTGVSPVLLQEDDNPDVGDAMGEAAAALPQEDDEPGGGAVVVFEDELERNFSSIPAYSQKDCSLITANALTIGEHTLIRGHVKTHGNLVIGDYATVTGNIYAEGNIHLKPGCRILGTVFSQGHVILAEGVTIGSKGRIKSVVSKKGIVLHGGVRVYGYVSTEGEGIVV